MTPAAPAEVPAREMRVLVEVSRALTLSDELRPSLARALDYLRLGTGAQVCSIWLKSADGGNERVARAGMSDEYLREFDRAGGPRAVTEILRGFDSVRIVGPSELVQESGGGFRALYSVLNLRSVCLVPLVTPRYFVGALILGHVTEGWFERHAIEFYRSVGEILGNAIDNARLFEELRRSEDRHAGLLRSAQDGIGCLDARGRFREANPAIERLLGRTRDQLVGRRLLEFVPRDQRASLRRVFEGPAPPSARLAQLGLELRNAAGERVPIVVNASPLRDARGDIAGTVFVLQDERERLSTERRARAALRTLETMLQHLAEGVALVDGVAERIVSCNAAFARFVGGAGRSLEGVALADVFPQYDSSGASALVRAAAQGGSNRTATDLSLSPRGREREFWSLTAAPLSSDGDGRRLLLLTVADTTSRRELDERVRQSQKLAAVGTLAGGIAHEYNNLLTAILGQVSIALADLPADHPLIPGLRDVESASLRAAELTQQLLGFGRRAPVEPRPMPVRPVVESLVPLLQRTFDPRVVIRTEFAHDLWDAALDPARFGEAVMHLCLNARDAMAGGGELVISVVNVRLEPRPGAPAGDFLQLDVRDTGAGMPPEVLARMYEPFYTTKGAEGGTGLGLASVHGIVEQHHGWIECESAPGRGTRFSVYVPRAVGRTPAPPSELPATVMVVDEEPSVRSLARLVLERRGYRVVAAADGVEALGRIEAGERPDLVLLDLTMPKLSGADTLRRLRAASPDVRVVLTTGYGAASALESGQLADAFLPKPFTPDRLAEIVREVLQLRR